MKIGLYPGCSFEGSAREYAESLRAIAPPLGMELEEVEGWSCCGASSAHAIDHGLSLALPASILAQAERQKMDEMVVPCAACFNRLASAKSDLAANARVRQQVADMIGMSYAGTTIVRNILEVLDRVLTPEVSKTFPNTFPHKVVCYYGCLLVRPKSVTREGRIEDPVQMDELMNRIGAKPLDWGMKTECCGASLSVTRTDVVGRLSGNILEDAAGRGAEAIIVACPMCHSNLDMRRKDIERTTGKKFSIPILYVTQAIGLALGLDHKQLGMQRHFVPVDLKGKSKIQIKPQTGVKAAV
ncbi:MAG TPA: CoB--CoM heterodisulfide reductase iron-sulfur subunit B family protein [Candidatus Acidoferrales bacterium]|nr:CoB--CoM heterodisulfide reductase iron-sulfur subunit B family protein [Candidatus Acidoferrales bacterium]